MIRDMREMPRDEPHPAANTRQGGWLSARPGLVFGTLWWACPSSTAQVHHERVVSSARTGQPSRERESSVRSQRIQPCRWLGRTWICDIATGVDRILRKEMRYGRRSPVGESCEGAELRSLRSSLLPPAPRPPTSLPLSVHASVAGEPGQMSLEGGSRGKARGQASAHASLISEADAAATLATVWRFAVH